jgi:hypothetical protein
VWFLVDVGDPCKLSLAELSAFIAVMFLSASLPKVDSNLSLTTFFFFNVGEGTLYTDNI